MSLKIKDITFVVVSYKSESTLYDCLDSLPNETKKIIVENSNNINLKKELINKYDNIEVILSKNIGMGAGNNIGLNACTTDYAFVLNPDAILNKDTLVNLIAGLQEVKDFTLASPVNDNPNFPNFKTSYPNSKNVNVLPVTRIDGFSMFFNMKKFTNENFFDENFFLYLENDDLCLRLKKNKQKIYVVKNSLIRHEGGISKYQDLELLRNWHWMWSKFYFNRKHYGYVLALFMVSSNFFSGCLKFLFNLIIFNTYKRKIYKMRIFGLLNSILGKKSWYR